MPAFRLCYSEFSRALKPNNSTSIEIVGFGVWVWQSSGSQFGTEYFAANAFALMGLRALYFLLKGLLDKLIYLSLGLSIILMFIGVKLIMTYLHEVWYDVPKIPIVVSLLVIALILVVSTVASLIKSKRDPSATAHAGRVTGVKHPEKDA